MSHFQVDLSDFGSCGTHYPSSIETPRATLEEACLIKERIFSADLPLSCGVKRGFIDS
jgi:hypothetical protein